MPMAAPTGTRYQTRRTPSEQAAKDIIAGAPVKAICRRWEAQGLRGTRGRPLTPQVVAHIMTSEWVAGRRGGRPAQWPAVLDEETWRLVSAVIKAKATGRSYARTLLSGIATCGLCGHTLASRPKGEGKPAYVCARDLGGCGKIVILAADFEQDVLERLFSRIDPDQLHSGPADNPTAEAMAELSRLEGVKKQLAELAGAGELDITEFRAARAANEQRDAGPARDPGQVSRAEEALQRTRAEALDLRAKWDDLDIDRRRQVVQALAERIEVRAGGEGQELLLARPGEGHVPLRVTVTQTVRRRQLLDIRHRPHVPWKTFPEPTVRWGLMVQNYRKASRDGNA